MDKSAIEKIKPYGTKNLYSNIFRTALLSVMLTSGIVTAMYNIWQIDGLGYGMTVILTIFTVAVLSLTQILKSKYRFAKIFLVIPFLLLFVFTGFRGFFEGFKAFLNMLILNWNNIHEGGLALFKTYAGQSDAMAFTLMVSVLATFISWFLASERRFIITSLFCLFWLLLQLLTETFGKVSGVCILSALAGVCIYSGSVYTAEKGIVWFAVLFVIFLAGAYFVPTDEIMSVDGIRYDTKEQINAIRYGKPTFPEGDLQNADMLNDSGEDMLTVKTEQEKNTYIHGFVGGNYRNGKWSCLEDSHYGGDYFGMLKWLKNRGFNPNTQVAYYYSLCDKDIVPETNNVEIDVKSANRHYGYLPSTLNAVTEGRMKDKKDEGSVSGGFFGLRHYGYSEISSSRPSELTVADLWVSNPRTEEQEKYVQSEAVYRDFVYKNYVSLDNDVYDYVNKLFWEDYNSENSGIYSLLNHIREVLKENAEYTSVPESIPDGAEPVIWFLDKEHKGNSMFFASAAAAAFRAYGIPARYAEGYFLRSSDIVSNGGNGEVNLTGKDAHAWIEVYFDGIGWLPIDTTPGFYYDAVTLQQMISTPDTVKKTAALENNFSGAEKTADTNGSAYKNIAGGVKEGVKNVSIMLLGLLALCIVAMAVIFVIAEIMRLLKIMALKRRYNNAEPKEKVSIIGKIIFAILSGFGINARLGWETDMTDKLISERFSNIEKGEYRRICNLIEKTVYGGAELEIFEGRTLKNFVEKLFNELETPNIESKIKKRYLWIMKQKVN